MSASDEFVGDRPVPAAATPDGRAAIAAAIGRACAASGSSPSWCTACPRT
jgi:hypothetical protein